jgi:hypothetical protein
MKDNTEYTEIKGRLYRYDPELDSYYPVPTKEQYGFQKFVMFVSSLLVIAYICYHLVEKL